MQIYVVKQGDTVDTIAGEYGVSVEDIIYDNQIPYPYRLAVGMALLLRITGEGSAGRYDAYVNGYAYPFISNYVLNQTLPYLSSLSIFSYGFTTGGNLIPPAIDESFMIQAALLEDVAPILTLTPFGADGMFNNYLISVLVNNQPVRDTLIAQLLFTMEQKGYQGVDIDFEYILPEDRDAFTAFVAETRAAANAEGYTLSVALAPKISDTQTGLLYEGKDYEGLGRAADSVLLMTYEWGVYLRSADGRRAPQQSDRGGGIRHNKNPSRKNRSGHTQLRLRLAPPLHKRREQSRYHRQHRSRPDSN